MGVVQVGLQRASLCGAAVTRSTDAELCPSPSEHMYVMYSATRRPLTSIFSSRSSLQLLLLKGRQCDVSLHGVYGVASVRSRSGHIHADCTLHGVLPWIWLCGPSAVQTDPRRHWYPHKKRSHVICSLTQPTHAASAYCISIEDV